MIFYVIYKPDQAFSPACLTLHQPSWQLSNFTGGGRPRLLFGAGTWIAKSHDYFKIPVGFQTHSGECKWFQRP
jgi:hypothetical protein